MKLNKETVKQIALILAGILFMCMGYFNYSFTVKNETKEIARKREFK